MSPKGRTDMRSVPAVVISILFGLMAFLSAQSYAQGSLAVPLDGKLKTQSVLTSWERFNGSPALEVRRPLNLQQSNDVQSIVVLPIRDFRDGTIELDVEGHVGEGADPGARGFVGLAFHLSSDAGAFDAFYLRPTNGRADDQLRRNHALQYVSIPEYDFQRFRTDSPGVYESLMLTSSPTSGSDSRLQSQGRKPNFTSTVQLNRT